MIKEDRFVTFCLAAVLLLSAPVHAQPWDTLFNGKDMTGWRVMGKPADVAKNFIKVDNGTVLLWAQDGNHDYLWFYSNKEYRDFNLNLKFQSVRGDACNSGTQVRSRYDTVAYWLDGPQLDIEAPMVGAIWDETRGSGRWLVDLYHPTNFIWSDSASGWNQLEISVIGYKITQKLNGVQVTNYDGTGVLDDAVHKSHNVGMTGHIVLQIHAGLVMKIRFKDIYIQDLSGTGTRNTMAVVHEQRARVIRTARGIDVVVPGIDPAHAVITDMAGHIVREMKSAGSRVSWDGRGEAGQTMAQGLYIVHITTPHGIVSEPFFFTR
jgi:hypothetical protein